MATVNEQLTELRQYIEDLEEGLTIRLDGLGVRLEAIENQLTLINAGPAASGLPEAGETQPPADEPGL